jgi:hypothetical protein
LIKLDKKIDQKLKNLGTLAKKAPPSADDLKHYG